MANRRMFNEQIVESDAFLELPLSSQALYIHLNMSADDDGLVNNAKRITKVIGASENDLKTLISKRFILNLGDGVVCIKHWFINNLLRKDRKKNTLYQDKAEMLEIKENGAYTEKVTTKTQPNDNQNATKCQADGCVREEKRREEKRREEKIREEKGIEEKHIRAISKREFEEQCVNEFYYLWQMYPRKQGKSKAFKAYLKARLDGAVYKDIQDGLHAYIAYIKANKTEQRYIKMGSTWFNQECWNDDYTIQKQDRNAWIDNVDLEGEEI